MTPNNRPIKAKTKTKAAASAASNQGLKMSAAAIQRVPANIFIADLNFEIVSMNDCAMQTLRGLAEVLRQTFGVEVDEMIGLSIHKFHQDPKRVERILT